MYRQLVGILLVASLCECSQWFTSPTGAVNGTGTASNPFPSLSAAVAAAGAGDTVVLLPGTYVGPSNLISVSKKVNIISQQGKYATIFSCGGSSNNYVSLNSQGTEVSGITFNNCYKGVYALGSCLISDCTFNGCSFGIHASGNGVTVQVLNSVFQSNGEGLYASGSVSFTVVSSTISTSSRAIYLSGASLTMSSSKISGNSLGIQATGGSSLLLDGTTFSNNVADNGGAVYLDASSATTSNCVFYNNTAKTNGGAMWIGNKSTLVDFGSKLDSNSAVKAGGALRVISSSIANLFGSAVTNNSADEGGDYSCAESSFIETQNVTNSGNRSSKPGSCTPS